MNKRSVLIILLFFGLTLIGLSACQSGASAVAGATAVSGAAASVSSTAAEPTSTSAPTSTPEVLAALTPTSTNEPTAVPTAEPSVTPTAEPSVTPTAEPSETPTPSPEPGIIRSYEIVPDGSEVRFYIEEVLFGNPKTVAGRTNQVAGEVLLDLQNPQEVEIRSIQINARGLATDNEFRNRSLQRQILDSVQDEYQFITFTPTEIEGLNAGAAVIGETQTFNLSGDLQIRDIVQPVMFEMMVTAVSETELNGFGEGIVLRSDYDLQIPSVTGVANVSDEVKLEIEFVARSGV